MSDVIKKRCVVRENVYLVEDSAKYYVGDLIPESELDKVVRLYAPKGLWGTLYIYDDGEIIFEGDNGGEYYFGEEFLLCE